MVVRAREWERLPPAAREALARMAALAYDAAIAGTLPGGPHHAPPTEGSA